MHRLRQAIQIAGDELQSRVVKRGAAIVGQRHPAVEIGGLVVARDRQHVVGIPGKIAGQVGGFDLLLARAGIFQRHQQRGAIEEVCGDFRKAKAFGVHPGDDVVANFPHWAVVVRQQRGLDLLVLGGAIFLVGADQGHFLAHVLVQQLRRFQQVVFVVLLDDAEFVGVGERAEMHGSRIHRGGDVFEFQAEGCRSEA